MIDLPSVSTERLKERLRYLDCLRVRSGFLAKPNAEFYQELVVELKRRGVFHPNLRYVSTDDAPPPIKQSTYTYSDEPKSVDSRDALAYAFALLAEKLKR